MSSTKFIQVHLFVCPCVEDDSNLIETWSIPLSRNISNDITTNSASCVISPPVHDHFSHVLLTHMKIYSNCDKTPDTIIIATLCYYN